MNLVTVENISKTYGDKELFSNITFGIQDQDRIGFIGINGTGKSTFLKIIAGLVEPDSGRRIANGQARVEYLFQNPEFDNESTVLQQVFIGTSPLMQVVYDYHSALNSLHKNTEDNQLQKRVGELTQKMEQQGAWELEANAKAILTKLGITDFSATVGQLSGGQRKRIAMARALIQPSELLILDEPTNHIDNETVEWLEEYLKKWKGALLLITHDRYFLNRVVNKIIELDDGSLYSYEGNYEAFLEKKAEREEQLSAMERKHAGLLRNELAWLKKGAKARTTKQKARIQRAEKLQEVSYGQQDSRLDISLAASQRLGKKVLEMKHISKAFEGKQLIDDFTHMMTPGERVGIVGRNGIGKSTLLNILAGRIQPDKGVIEIGQTVKLSYYDQESSEMNEKMRVIDYIKEAAEYVKTADGAKISASQMLERFLFPSNVQWTPIASLSGGERRRLYLLRKLMEEPNLLLMDEPTNDLDIHTLTILEDYLEGFPGSVVIVSHDRYFLDRTVDHLFIFEGDGKIIDYHGSYSDYALMRSQWIKEEAKALEAKEEKQAYKPSTDRPKKKLSFKEQKEFDEIDSLIASLEEELEKLQTQIDKGGSNYELLQEYLIKQKNLQEKLDYTMERWMYLTELMEEIEGNK